MSSIILIIPPNVPGLGSIDSSATSIDQKQDEKEEVGSEPVLSRQDAYADALDDFNHPRLRRAMIVQEFVKQQSKENGSMIVFQSPSKSVKYDDVLEMYQTIHSAAMLNFFQSAWERWVRLGDEGRDPSNALPFYSSLNQQQQDEKEDDNNLFLIVPPLIPGNVPLMIRRGDEEGLIQEPSKSVMGQVGYYCTDMCTPIFEQLRDELEWDAAVIEHGIQTMFQSGGPTTVYVIPTHPGHHASRDSFGGYCYLNQAAYAARRVQTLLLQQQNSNIVDSEESLPKKVAILDLDYHCGNGTISIFYNDPTVLVVSIHCDPDYEYPFHCGFAHQTGSGKGRGTTLNLPLPPRTTDWQVYLKDGLEPAMNAIQSFQPQALIISLGLDTHDQDPCALRRAGFRLKGNDYVEMGKRVAQGINKMRQMDHQNDNTNGSFRPGQSLPTIIIQEGGYRMEKVPEAAYNFTVGFHGMKS